MTQSNKNDIYRILGIDPNHKSNSAHRSKYGTSSHRPSDNFVDDPNQPSGSIFDNYKKYPSDLGYWQYFRILTIIGIVTVLCVIVLPLIDFSSGGSRYARVDYDENEYEEEASPERQTYFTLPENIYFKGEINNIPVTVRLNLKERRGEYYYDRNYNGSNKNNMKLNVLDLQYVNGRYALRLGEYNPQGKRTGYWQGKFSNGKFTGNGEYLGKTLPFELKECSKNATGF